MGLSKDEPSPAGGRGLLFCVPGVTITAVIVKEIIMRELKTVIQIAAPIDQVWQVLTDFNNWQEWNPMVNQVSGNAVVGSRLNITMCGAEGKDAMKYQATILETNPPNSLRWRATMLGGLMFTNDRVFELKEENGVTELVNKEAFSGYMVPLFWGKMQPYVVPMLEKMNQALKAKIVVKS